MGEKVKSYKDLLVWQKGIGLIKEIYRVIKKFSKEETYVLSDQLRRAAISIPSNIAKGASQTTHSSSSNNFFISHLDHWRNYIHN
ncbi:MAG: four helix bundle protein [Candidatus Zixiibacteriota bacterium]